MGNIVSKCQYGYVHSTATCRCMDSHTTTRHVKCPTPSHHSVSSGETDSTVQPLHARLQATLHTFLGSAVMPVVTDSMADHLENDVKEWLADHANQMTKE